MDSINPIVSVIVPMYNVEKYIEKCVESIENQTLQQIEIILIDDGSNDNTLSIANSLKDKCDNIILIHQENRGQAAARNKGYTISNGKYISFVDADDYIEPDMFEFMVNKSELNNLDIMECCYDDVYPETGKQGRSYFIQAEREKVYTGVDFYNLKVSLSPCDKIYNHAFLQRIEYKCTEGHYAEDVYDTSYAILSANRVMHENKIVYHYRRDNMGSTRNNANIGRRIKLGEDKLYISILINNLRKEKNVSGYINTIIVRNVAGTRLCPIYFKSREYRREIKQLYKKYNGNALIKENISFGIFFELLKVGIVKIIKKGD